MPSHRESLNGPPSPIHRGQFRTIELKQKGAAGTKDTRHFLNGIEYHFLGEHMLEHEVTEYEIHRNTLDAGKRLPFERTQRIFENDRRYSFARDCISVEMSTARTE